MRSRSLLAVTVLSSVATLNLACGSSDYPNPYMTFNSGQESDTFDDVSHYELERVDTDGNSEQVLSVDSLPAKYDMGEAGTYQYTGTGYNDDNEPVAIGRTLTADATELLGSEIPMFFARKDKASRPVGSFTGTPKQNPVAGILWGRFIWYLDDSSKENLVTDSYSVAYWEQVDPAERYLSIECPEVPCNLKNIVVVNYSYAFAIAEKWALGIDTTVDTATKYSPPDGLSAWSDIAGGRTLSGGNGTAVVVGPTRQSSPSKAILGFSLDDDSTIAASYAEVSTARAGAALLYEEDFGMVISGGSSDGAGVERLAPDSKEFVELPYPADPVIGAALVMEDKSHLLRVGGLTENGDAAPTVRIDIECSKDCEYEAVSSLDLSLRNAQSFYDSLTKQTLVVGENADGLTQVYRYKSDGFVEITFSKAQQRVRALALVLPNQQLALVGGTDPDNETTSRQDISVIAF